MKKANVIGVIPARWGSTRFPGKSLALIGGKPLIVHVIERAHQATRLDSILVATDDARIAEAAQKAGVKVAMTRSDHPSGTDRIAEAIQGQDAEVVINIQGDEPLIDPRLIDQLADTLARDTAWDMATAATPIKSAEDLNNPSVVKVVWDQAGRALYFSRAVIPFVRDVLPPGSNPPVLLHWRHLGIYAYQNAFLARMVSEPPCALELAEKLEQLRALHLGCRMKVLQTDDQGLGVDCPADLPKAEALMRAAGLI